MMRLLRLFLILGVIVSCADEGPTDLLPPPADHQLSDGANAGNPHFFFLPPMVPQPLYSGTFNPHLTPRVEICAWAAGASLPVPEPRDICADGALHADYSMSGGTGGEVVRLAVVDEQYQVNWHTDVTAAVDGGRYRILVSVSVFILGWADIEIATTGKEAKNITNGGEEIIGLVDGRTLPVKFRIEEGAFLGTTACEVDCFEGMAGPAGGDFTTPSKDAGIRIFENNLSTTVLLTIGPAPINPANPQECLPTDLEQKGLCYDFDTWPHTPFTVTETDLTTYPIVGTCLQVTDTDPAYDQWLLHRYTQENNPRVVEGQPVWEGVVALPSAAASFLDCTPEITMFGDGVVGRLANATMGLLRPVTRLIVPQVAHAIDIGLGGRTGEISRIGWARPVDLAWGSALPAEELTGRSLPASVEVFAAHYHFDPIDEPECFADPIPDQCWAVPGSVLQFIFATPSDPSPLANAVSTGTGHSATMDLAFSAGAGAYGLEVVGPGRSWQLGDPAQVTTVPSPKRLSHSFRVREPVGSIGVLVADDSDPAVPLAGVSVTLSSNGAALSSATTGSDGTASFPGLSLGTYTVAPSGTDLTFTPTSAEVTLSSDGQQAQVSFVGSAAVVLGGTVIGGDRTGLPAVQVSARSCGVNSTLGSWPGGGSCTEPGAASTTATDETGVFSFSVSPGPVEVQPSPRSAGPEVGFHPYRTVTDPTNPLVKSPAFEALYVDQEQTGFADGGTSIGGSVNQRLAQTFTAGASGGALYEVHLPVSCSATDLHIAIEGVITDDAHGPIGAPNGTALVPATLLPASFVSAEATAFQRLPLSSVPTLTGGQQYAIVVSAPGGSCNFTVGPLGDTYAGGAAWFAHDGNEQAWVRFSRFATDPEGSQRGDYPFRTTRP